jgi:hypothetical protein
MTISHVQGAIGPDTASGSVSSVCVTLTSTVGFGNFVCGAVVFGQSGASAPTLSSVKDDKGNTYTVVDTFYDNTNFECTATFYLANITNGPKTITATLAAASPGYVRMVAAEYSGTQPRLRWTGMPSRTKPLPLAARCLPATSRRLPMAI